MTVITGYLSSVEHRQGGWVRASVLEPGKQYPTKMDTKREDLVSQVIALAGQQVTVEFNEYESDKINPHNQRPYINRYIEHIVPGAPVPVEPTQLGAGGYTPPPAQPQQPVSRPPQRQGDETMIRRVTWLSAASTASQMLSGLVTSNDPETLRRMGGALFSLADSIYAKARQVERGSLEGNTNEPDPGPADMPPPPTDDDIPF